MCWFFCEGFMQKKYFLLRFWPPQCAAMLVRSIIEVQKEASSWRVWYFCYVFLLHDVTDRLLGTTWQRLWSCFQSSIVNRKYQEWSERLWSILLTPFLWTGPVMSFRLFPLNGYFPSPEVRLVTEGLCQICRRLDWMNCSFHVVMWPPNEVTVHPINKTFFM